MAKANYKIRPGHVILALIVLYFLALLRTDWTVFTGLKESRTGLNRAIGRAERERERLKRELVLLKRPDQIELFARERLGLIKQGETAYKVIFD